MTFPWDPSHARGFIARYQAVGGPMLPILQDLQEAFGYIGEDAMRLVAQALNVSRAEVYSVVSFYHDFRQHPPGRYVLKICRAEACQAMGGEANALALPQALGLGWGGTTPDGRLTGEPVCCLGLCACAPSAMLDGVLHVRLDTAWVGVSLFLAGEAGALRRSDDQCRSFQMLGEPTQSTFLRVMDAGGGVVFAYGVAGNAYRSIDHGKSWLAVSIASSSDLTSAVMLPSGKILVAKEDGNVFESTDHATTFSTVTANQNMELFGLASVANGDVAFVGTGGVHVVPASLLAQ